MHPKKIQLVHYVMIKNFEPMQKIKYSISLLLLSLMMSSSIQAQTENLLTLDDVIYIAQQQSPNTLIAKHRFRRSYWEFRTYKATYLPSVKFDGTLPNINQSIDRITLEDGSDIYRNRQQTSYAANLSINQKIGFTGGNLFVRSGISRLDNIRTDTTMTSYLSTPINIGYSQPLFTYNAYKWDKKIEPMKYQEAKRKYLEDNEQVALTATDNFFNLLSAQLEKEISLKNYAYYDTLYRIAFGRYNLGKIAENEILQLELNLLKAESSVERSELAYENKLFVLKSFLRIPLDQKVALLPPTNTAYFSINVAQAVEEAKENTSQGISFTRRLMEAESSVDKAKMDGRFDAEIYAVYGLTQTAADLRGAYQNPLEQKQLTVGIQIPIIDWGLAKGRIRMAQSSQELVKTSVEQERIDFEQNIFLKAMEFALQENQILIAAKSDTVAQKRYKVTNQRYMIGKVNDVLELNNAQIDNDNARLSYYRALRNYWMNYYEIRKLTLYDFKENRKIDVDFEGIM